MFCRIVEDRIAYALADGLKASFDFLLEVLADGLAVQLLGGSDEALRILLVLINCTKQDYHLQLGESIPRR